jgi:hypothetical protein
VGWEEECSVCRVDGSRERRGYFIISQYSVDSICLSLFSRVNENLPVPLVEVFFFKREGKGVYRQNCTFSGSGVLLLYR